MITLRRAGARMPGDALQETADFAGKVRDGTDFAMSPTACRYVGWTSTR